MKGNFKSIILRTEWLRFWLREPMKILRMTKGLFPVLNWGSYFFHVPFFFGKAIVVNLIFG
jgi:hypothetical protein